MVRTDRGRWVEENFPITNWEFIEINELEKGETHLCDMQCGTKSRHVHKLKHPECDEIIEVGEKCAGHLVIGYGGVESRKLYLSLINKKKKLRRYFETMVWNTSRKGNPYTHYKNFQITVFARLNGYNCLVSKPHQQLWGEKTCLTIEEAKLEAIDLLWEVVKPK